MGTRALARALALDRTTTTTPMLTRATTTNLSTRSLAGTPVRERAVARSTGRIAMMCKAKYGDESVYFDLSDVEATTGSWDVYGVDARARYPDQQAAFFEYAAQGLGRREAVYSLLAVSAGLLTVAYGVKGAKDAGLPITVGPQKEPVVGPRDRI